MELSSQRILFFAYFIALIALGSFLLYLPVSWNGYMPITFIDALFTSTSAVCVTGLITKGTEQFSFFGKTVILMLIQFGGLGIITFTTIFLALPRARVSFHSISLVKKYFIDTIEFKSHHIIRNILLATITFETIGTLLLFGEFKKLNIRAPLFTAIFHSVSAFCNAGFSTFVNSLEGFKYNNLVLLSIALLIFTGGIGFVVLDDIRRKILYGKRFSLYTKIVLGTSIALILCGMIFYLILESNNIFNNMTAGNRIINALFQSVTTRTAGFNSIKQLNLGLASKVFTLPLMLIGGGSGSIAGGIKVSTFFIIIAVIFFGIDSDGEVRIGNRKIDRNTIAHAFIFFGKAIFLLFFAALFLTVTETISDTDFTFIEILFEVISAFGTVGLSLGITDRLSEIGKLVIIGTMFAGRIGLVSMAISIVERKEADIDVLAEEVLIG